MTFTKGKLIRLPDGIDPDNFDFDHPNSLDFNAMYRCLVDLVDEKEVKTPVYCFKTHKQLPNQHKLLSSTQIIIFEGILCMHDERIRKLFDLKIFIHCDPDIALARRIKRDVNDRGRDVTEVLKRYNRFVKKDFDKYVKPQMKYVDFTIPGGANNDVAMNIIVQNLKNRLITSKVKKSDILSIEDQFKDLLCMDLSKIISPAQLQCPMLEDKYLINNYLGMMQSNDQDYVKSNMELLVNRLAKDTLALISEDLNHKITIPLGEDCQIYCKNYSVQQKTLNTLKPRFILFFETLCSTKTMETLIEQYKNQKGIPIYGAFIFIEKNVMEHLYKEIDLLKMVCLYPQYNLSELKNIQVANTGSYAIEKLSDMGDHIVREKFGIENK